jgi:branched-chain amino acid transport system permease protein
VNWDKLVQLVVDGLTTGSVYALIALGFSIVYGILRLLNFAHGDVFMVGAFIGFFVEDGFGGPTSPAIPLPALIALMFVLAMLGCGVLGLLIERFAYRRLRDAPRVAALITALGVSFFLQNTALLLFGAQHRSYSSYEFHNGSYITSGIHWGPLNVSILRLLTMGLTLVLMALLTFVIRRTRLGKAMRATALDREAAAMMGINPDRVIAAAFFIASALAGAAGVMFGLVFNDIFHFMGFENGLKAFTACVLGGIGSVPGAALGGILIGLAEAFCTGYLPQGSTFVDFWVFSILIIVLIARPSGLLGKAAINKV